MTDAWTRRLATARAQLDEVSAGQAGDDEVDRDSALLQVSALVEVGRSLMALARFDEAGGPLAEAETTLARLTDVGSATARVRLLRAQLAIALREYSEALAIVARIASAGDDPGMPSFPAYIATIRLEALLRLARFSEALREAQTVIDAAGGKGAPGGRDLIPAERRALAMAYSTQSAAAQKLGQTDLALRGAELAVETERALSDEPDDPDARTRLARAMLHRASLLEDLGDRGTANGAFSEFIREFRGSSGEEMQGAVRKVRARRLGLRLGIRRSGDTEQ